MGTLHISNLKVKCFRPYLIERGLGHGVVLHPQPLLVTGELAKDVGQSPLCVREMVLQCVVMLLLQDAAQEGPPDKVLYRLQFRRRATNPHNHRVAITKPGTRSHN